MVAESANPAAAPAAVLPEELLQDGEVVILAAKPSGWFVLLSSGGVLALAGGVLLAVWLATDVLHAALPFRTQTVALVCMVVSSLRVTGALMQWQARLYVLTNRRMHRIHGVVRPDVYHVPLKRVTGLKLTATAGERLAGIGTLLFEVQGQLEPASAWLNLPRPDEVQRIVEQTIRMSR